MPGALLAREQAAYTLGIVSYVLAMSMGGDFCHELEEALEKRDELDEDFGSDLADASPQKRKQALEADEKREQAKQAFLDALEKNPSLMMTTAGSSFEAGA